MKKQSTIQKKDMATSINGSICKDADRESLTSSHRNEPFRVSNIANAETSPFCLMKGSFDSTNNRADKENN